MQDCRNPYNSSRWKRFRKSFLFDNPRCIMCLAMGRQESATEVDHVIPWGGNHELFWNNEFNALCKSCHSEKTYYETVKSGLLPNNIRVGSKDVTFLIGSPCSGKTTWAKKQGKKVIDLDDIKRDVSGQDPWQMDIKYLSTCLAVRNRLIERTKEPVIIISTMSSRKIIDNWSRKLKTKVTWMCTTQRKCLQWLKQSDRPNKRGIASLINRWYDEYIPSGKEVYVR